MEGDFQQPLNMIQARNKDFTRSSPLSVMVGLTSRGETCNLWGKHQFTTLPKDKMTKNLNTKSDT